MHFGFSHSLVVVALISSLWLLLQGGDRMFPTLAAIASVVEALIAFGLLTLSVARFRVDVILPGLLVVAAAVCWTRATSKGAISAAAIATMVGAIQLAFALGVV